MARLICFLIGHSDGWIRDRGAWRCVRCRQPMTVSNWAK